MPVGLAQLTPAGAAQFGHCCFLLLSLYWRSPLLIASIINVLCVRHQLPRCLCAMHQCLLCTAPTVRCASMSFVSQTAMRRCSSCLNAFAHHRQPTLRPRALNSSSAACGRGSKTRAPAACCCLCPPTSTLCACGTSSRQREPSSQRCVWKAAVWVGGGWVAAATVGVGMYVCLYGQVYGRIAGVGIFNTTWDRVGIQGLAWRTQCHGVHYSRSSQATNQPLKHIPTLTSFLLHVWRWGRV